MKQNHRDKKPSSFAETVQLVESYVRAEIIQETKDKRLYYHNLDHALAVKRRANNIFQEIKIVLSQDNSDEELERLENLINLCGLAHDMVQLFDPPSAANQPRKRQVGLSETETANKLLQYIQNLNQELAAGDLNHSILFSDLDRQIIQDAIAATICDRDPQAGKAEYTFSPNSIYQPYLYNRQPKISIVGSIIALADLGALGMEGIENYIQDGILVFLEDNPDLEDLILNCDRSNYFDDDIIKARLLAMTRFMISLAYERQARFELEISEFAPQARQILRDKIFIGFNQENMAKITAIMPTQDNISLQELINFFCLNKNIDFTD
ncbi:MAG TPA: hypothetical protein V6C71_25700 [Coleofasciculaceae cyanobacterium]|jgi:hypothetical protein